MEPKGGAQKITYSTFADNQELHGAFETAAREVRGWFGQTHPVLIGGAERHLERTFDDLNPSDTRETLGRFARGGAAEVQDAVQAAAAAYPAWSRRDYRERAALLRAGADRISAHRFELAALMSYEVGKNRAEALGDTEEAADLLRYYCDQIESAHGFTRPLERLTPNEETRSVLLPYGVWGVIAPFNFPLALSAGMSGGALVAGNTVVFKPASDAPFTGLMLGRILQQAGLPPGVFNVVTGSAAEVGDPLIAHPALAGLIFTGSFAVGTELERRFSAHLPKPCILEMGGKNAAIVTAQADLELAAEGIGRSAFGYGGQKCSACSRAYVAHERYDELLERLVHYAGSVKIGDPLERGTFLGPLINRAAVDKYRSAVELARRDGRVVTGGGVLEQGGFEHGHFVTPAVVDSLGHDHPLLQEELFVPLLCVAAVADLDEAIARSNRSAYGLTAGIYSRDDDEVQTFFDRIEAGVTYANRRSGATTGAWPGVNSFCGWKGSGNSGKGACGPYYVAQFLREQSRTWMR
ncbi:MAG TPA: aldehyde dehydrogenase family protein [Acidobacteriota bacterium]